VGDTITTSSFYVSSVLNALPTTGGTVSGNLVVSGTETVSTITSPAATALTLQTNNGTTAITVDTSQNVGIGTTSPSSKFHVNATSAAVFIGYGANFDNYIQTNGNTLFTNYNASTEYMRINSSGKVMVNTTNNSGGGRVTIATANGVVGSGLDVTNTSGTAAYFAAAFYNNGTSYAYCGGISVSGTSTSYATSSDYRLKEDIQPMTGALAKVSALKPVTYKWKTDNSYSQGFIAHELQAIVPECVIGEKDAIDENGKPRYQGIDTSFLVATLTAAIQEQQALITQLQADVAALKGKP
jgi:hypothetical protein